jgi:SAM-dependent methyltransferase
VSTGYAPPCVVCGATDWLPLPDVGGGRSVTTAGRLILDPLGKAHCSHCGLVQRTAAPFLAQTDFYEKRYTFYERPGADRFDRPRYTAMARWIRAAAPTAPARILDAGCGRGWMMEAMQAVFPGAAFRGIEPSEAESENARQRGFDVATARVGRSAAGQGSYDLVYSTNVLEHTESPVDFLAGLRGMLAPAGRVVIICPDGSNPGSELMFSDQSFSFLPAHLEDLAAHAGLEVVRWGDPPAEPSLRDKQLVVLRRAAADRPAGAARAWKDVAPLYQARCDYLNAWKSCGERLSRECQRARHVYNFGTSTWSFLLAGYCRDYWTLVTACMIDGGSGEFFGKPVRHAAQVRLAAGDVVVMGVDPKAQAGFAARFADSPARTVAWNDIIAR